MVEKTKQLKYQQAYDKLLEIFKNYDLDEKLPSERKLAQELDCTVFTVRNALGHMEENGILTRRHGSGTFLRSKSVMNGRLQTALLLPPESGAYGQQILEAIFKVAQHLNFDARTVWIQNFKKDALRQVDLMKNDGVKSIILPWIPSCETENLSEFLKESPLPVTTSVCIKGFEETYFELPQIIGLDIVKIMEQLVDYYIYIGKKHIAILEPNIPQSDLLQSRFNAVSRALARHNMKMIFGAVDNAAPSVDKLVLNWKKYSGDLGVLCYDDTMALRFLTSMHKNGLKAPDDYAVIGFNNVEQGLYSDPPLTTISQDFGHLAEALLKHSRSAINGQVEQSTTLSNHNLIVRDTCGGRNYITEELKKECAANGLMIIA